MIGGPDLAKINLDSDELLLFPRRRLRDIFVTDQASLQRRLGAPDWGARSRRALSHQRILLFG